MLERPSSEYKSRISCEFSIYQFTDLRQALPGADGREDTPSDRMQIPLIVTVQPSMSLKKS